MTLSPQVQAALNELLDCIAPTGQTEDSLGNPLTLGVVRDAAREKADTLIAAIQSDVLTGNVEGPWQMWYQGNPIGGKWRIANGAGPEITQWYDFATEDEAVTCRNALNLLAAREP